PLHFLIGHPPIAAIDVLVVAAVLQKDANWLGLVLADQRRIDIAAAEAHIRTNRAEDPREGVWPLPGGSERTNGAAGAAANRPVIAALGKANGPAVGRGLFFDFRQQFVEDKANVVVA